MADGAEEMGEETVLPSFMGEETGLTSFMGSSTLPDVCAATPRDMAVPPDIPTAVHDMPAPPYEPGPCPECAGLYLPPYNMVIPKDACSLMLKKTSTACSFDTKSNVSDTSMFLPICRICHMSEMESSSLERLISPCRCIGSLQYIHNTCLMKWLEICSKRSRKPPRCELCHYQFHRHKQFKTHHWRFPHVTRQDKILHVIFFLNLFVMIACAVATVMCFLSDNGQIKEFPRNKKGDLTTEEIVTLACGVLFFVSFFISMSVQIKAKHTVYALLVKFITQNMEWEIYEYDKSKDNLFNKNVIYKGHPVAV